MNAIDIAPLAAALLGFIARELMSILPAVERNEGSPNRLSLRYYFSRPKNLVLLGLNACGAAVLYLGRHELASVAATIPWLGEHMSVGTPTLIAGAIGFIGASGFRFLAKRIAQ